MTQMMLPEQNVDGLSSGNVGELLNEKRFHLKMKSAA